MVTPTAPAGADGVGRPPPDAGDGVAEVRSPATPHPLSMNTTKPTARIAVAPRTTALPMDSEPTGPIDVRVPEWSEVWGVAVEAMESAIVVQQRHRRRTEAHVEHLGDDKR